MARLSEDVKREICTAMREIKDSRVANGLVTVSHVELTNDMSYCKIYVSAIGGKTDDAVECLQNAAGFFKKHINARIKMRKIPELIFQPDTSLDYYEHISRIIDNLPKRTDEKTEEESDDN